MAGILANSSSKTMVSGDTSANDVESGYIANEQITLTVTPSGTSYSWSQALPAGSVPVRSALTSLTDASSAFTPDVVGEYVITCLVSGTITYVIRLSVVSATPTSALGAMRMLPVPDASVPTPATGATLYYSSTQTALSIKKTDGTVHTIDLTAV